MPMVPPDDVPMQSRYGDDAPVNRYATLQDLSATERRLTNQLDELRSGAWKLAGVILAGSAVLASLVEIIRT